MRPTGNGGPATRATTTRHDLEDGTQETRDQRQLAQRHTYARPVAAVPPVHPRPTLPRQLDPDARRGGRRRPAPRRPPTPPRTPRPPPVQPRRGAPLGAPAAAVTLRPAVPTARCCSRSP